MPVFCDYELAEDLVVLQKQLFASAAKGSLLIQEEHFLQSLTAALKRHSSDAYSSVKALVAFAEQHGIIQRTVRKFAHLSTLCFISLHLEVISYECLRWVVQSLRQDEMTPTERAVQSRIKEAFALKLSPNVWQEAIR